MTTCSSDSCEYFIEYLRKGERLWRKTVFVESREQAQIGADKLIVRHRNFATDVVRVTCTGSGEYEEWTYGYWKDEGWTHTKSTYRQPHPIDEASPK